MSDNETPTRLESQRALKLASGCLRAVGRHDLALVVEELERQIVVISAESEKLKEMVARYLVAIYDVPIRQVDCQMDTDKIDQLHDDIVDEIGQEYIAKAQEGGE